MPPDRNEREGHPDTRPYLCLPYWTTPVTPGGRWDSGEVRPLPGKVVSYLCDAIRTSAYRPGVPMEVTVDVRNSGGGNSASLATVVLYWAVPSVGFANPRFLAATVVAVSPGRAAPSTSRTAVMTATIPAGAPDHVCLVVSVSHAQDRAGPACDPVNDRHWAQRNLTAATVAVGAPALVPFLAANPFDEGAVLQLAVEPVPWEAATAVAAAVGALPSDQRARARLLDEAGTALSVEGERTSTTVELGPLEQRPLQVLVSLEADVPTGRSAALELTLRDLRERGGAVGSLGVVLLPPEA